MPKWLTKFWLGMATLLLAAVLLFNLAAQPLQGTVPDWTGFGPSTDMDVVVVIEQDATGKIIKETRTNQHQAAKTLWDWMGLLLAPATLASLGFLFQSSQERTKEAKEASDKARDADQQREQALQTYFDQASKLLVEQQLKQRLAAQKILAAVNQPDPTDASNNVAVNTATKILDAAIAIDTKAALDVIKARTFALFRLFQNNQDMIRKASVLSFLGDSDLLEALQQSTGFELSGSDWQGANLRRANLRHINLVEADLTSASLNYANLTGANLTGANLAGANLNEANLSKANLTEADLSGAGLRGANLQNAKLRSAKLENADFSKVNLRGANLVAANISGVNLDRTLYSEQTLFPAGFKPSAQGALCIAPNANLSRAHLRNADLSDADLNGADLKEANLVDANLINADLRGADLNGAILRGAKFWHHDWSDETELKKAQDQAIAQLKTAQNWDRARYSAAMRGLLGLPELPEPK